MSTLAYLGLGANLGDPIQQLVDARKALVGLASTLQLRCSNFYASSPVDYEAQPDFINCVVELETSSGAIELLDDMQAIENALGRHRVADNQNAPRVIDIDLLLFGDQSIDIERLQVPHPRMNNRLFVLKPLLELAELERYRTALEVGDFEGQVLAKLTIGR
ncbi:MAG: 2-amino-4-hydroxy-6-hydroxymethyldihydropteridine diphosphokinase [Arenicella sp.]|nr:2-amino-4-hydroxy-6-hydroxymethyldihydropteridine diphosphokinase [Arenicella sp.]